MNCQYCQNQISDESNHCPFCGRSVQAQTAPQHENTGYANNYQQPNYSQQTYNPYGNNQQTYDPYANNQQTYDPHANNQQTYDPYGNNQQANNPYGNNQVPYNTHVNVQDSFNPYMNSTVVGIHPATVEINSFAEHARKLKIYGIVATVLMFGIGIFFSIAIWVSGKKIPQVVPPTPMDAEKLAKGMKDYNTAKILSFAPIVGIIISIIIALG